MPSTQQYYGGSPLEPRTLLREGQACLLVYRMPGTSAEFSLQGVLHHIMRRGQTDYLCLSGGCELRLDWLVAVNGHRLAA
ncbi:hypothetical protein ACFPAF_09905 [Hymenobacter endophyticus]|uniref:Uncharacterized protein n=1 Tax=Hymenobacter endophyticus TaxID=3076335 RepID=A0ABU3TH57_9BACT|nr:hypothetical protein [Hymenobacter endophyticus]MDU0370706.1 hypothetical protein [Hymenobacter endophyticus]